MNRIRSMNIPGSKRMMGISLLKTKQFTPLRCSSSRVCRKKTPAGYGQQPPAGKNQMVKVPRTSNIAKMRTKSTKFLPLRPGTSEEVPGRKQRMLQPVPDKKREIDQLLHVPRVREAPPARSLHAASCTFTHFDSLPGCCTGGLIVSHADA